MILSIERGGGLEFPDVGEGKLVVSCHTPDEKNGVCSNK